MQRETIYSGLLTLIIYSSFMTISCNSISNSKR